MSKKTAAFYNYFAWCYPLVDVFLKSQKRVLMYEVNHLPDGKLLEIGVGNGAHLKHFRHQVTGIDTSAAMLKTARKNCLGKMELLEMSGEALLFDDQVFDYVVLAHVIAVVDDAEQVLREVYRVLKPQGHLLILNHFTPDNWLRYFDLGFEALASCLRFKSNFRIGDLETIEKFTLQKEVSVGPASYFKVLVYRKG